MEYAVLGLVALAQLIDEAWRRRVLRRAARRLLEVGPASTELPTVLVTVERFVGFGEVDPPAPNG